MQLRRFTRIILLSAALLSVADAEERLDYYSPENVHKFADFLYEQGDYLRAAGEYQRYLFISIGKAIELTIELHSVIA